MWGVKVIKLYLSSVLNYEHWMYLMISISILCSTLKVFKLLVVYVLLSSMSGPWKNCSSKPGAAGAGFEFALHHQSSDEFECKKVNQWVKVFGPAQIICLEI